MRRRIGRRFVGLPRVALLVLALAAVAAAVAIPASAATGEFTICKIAGTGVTAGTNFSFDVGGTTVVVPAGSCVPAGQFPIGSNVTVQESVPSGMQVSAISVPGTDGATLVSSDLAAATAVVMIGGFHNSVSFTNQVIPTGELTICKIAGTGVTAGTNFSFTAGGVSNTVAAGSCVSFGQFPIGSNITVAESVPSGLQVSAISVADSAVLVSSNLAAGTALVTIGGFHNTVNVTNSVIPAAVCTYTKGFYKNHSAVVNTVVGAGLSLPTTISINGVATSTLTAAQVNAILQASPSSLSPGSGAALNLAQQALTALLNEKRGSTASNITTVNAAISAALGSLSVTISGGTVTAVTSTASDVGGLTNTIDAFNQSMDCG
jgi:hypothetical protein